MTTPRGELIMHGREQFIFGFVNGVNAGTPEIYSLTAALDGKGTTATITTLTTMVETTCREPTIDFSEAVIGLLASLYSTAKDRSVPKAE